HPKVTVPETPRTPALALCSEVLDWTTPFSDVVDTETVPFTTTGVPGTGAPNRGNGSRFLLALFFNQWLSAAAIFGAIRDFSS
ncbi:MAG TPA: hypothetical protein VF490_04300, partial [Chryseosolibacter sp.]